MRKKITDTLYRHTLATERATMAWWLLTTAAILVLWPWLPAVEMLTTRGWILVGSLAMWSIHHRLPCLVTKMGRHVVQFAWLALWYPETYLFNRLLPNLDHVAAQVEQNLFGCQPSIVFPEAVTSPLWSEAFNLGYYSYYYLLAVVAVWMAFVKPKELERHFGALLTAFFIYYMVFILVPVAGPQYYFQAIGLEQARDGVFPALGDYFATHTDMLPAPGPDGLFQRLVANAQMMGERPTAAFPSSHCGITMMLQIIAWRTSRTCLLTILPLALLLFAATVYIQAHYLIDALVGISTAPLLYYSIISRYDTLES